jgi:ABC-type multidrug transport system ATPase subunit
MIHYDHAALDYGPGRPALAATTLSIDAGLTLLLGPNGAGKSSLIKLAAGVERPRAGRVLVDGFDLWVDEVGARRRLAYVPEHPDVTPYASVVEVLGLVCRLRGAPLDVQDAALAHVGLTEYADRTIRELSMGQRRRMMLATALIGDPAHVLLDEPLETMDRAMQAWITAWVAKLVAAGVTILIATHQVEPFVDMATHAVAVHGGRVTVQCELPASPDERRELVHRLAREGR